MDNFRGKRERIRWTNGTGASVTSGDVVALNGRLGIAVTTIADGATGWLAVAGAFEVLATDAEAWVDGDPLWWDLTNLKLTRIGSCLHRFAGRAVGAKVATTQLSALVALNERGDLPEDLIDREWFDSAVDLTMVAATHSGGVVNLTADAKTVTLPVGVVGMELIIRNGVADAGALVTVDLNGNEIIAGANLTIAATKTALNTKLTAKKGDLLHLVCNVAATSWRCVRRRGIWVTS